MVWDILSGMALFGDVGGRLLIEHGNRKRAERLMAEREIEYQTWIDPVLEKETREYVRNPDNHDEL